MGAATARARSPTRRRTSPLLDALVDDPSPYVRRSVANHLNDIAKDHPALALDLARRWLSRDGPPGRRATALRTLVKRGDPQALELAGVTIDADVRLVELSVERDQLPSANLPSS